MTHWESNVYKECASKYKALPLSATPYLDSYDDDDDDTDTTRTRKTREDHMAIPWKTDVPRRPNG